MSMIDIHAMVTRYRQIRHLIEQLEDEADTIKAAITAEMETRQVTTLQTELFTVRWTPYQTSRIDTTALKEDFPDMAARYTKAVEARRFQVA